MSTGFKPVGMIEAAADARPAAGVPPGRRVPAPPRARGRTRSRRSEIADLFPWAKTDDLLAGFHIPGDGRVNPVDLTMSLAKGAKHLGVRVVEGVAVTDVLTRDGEVTGVVVSAGAADEADETATIECEYVVNCTGMWARELGERNGLVSPTRRPSTTT